MPPNDPSSGHSTIGAVTDIVANIRSDVRHIVQGEIELAKKELIPSAKSAGIGAGLLIGALYFAITAALLLFITAAFGIYAAGLPLWASFLIVGGALLILAAVLGGIGVVSLKKAKKPEATIREAQTTITSIKGAVARGTAAAKAPQIES